jgi:hypothetical protein
MKNIFTLLAVVSAFALGAQSLELVTHDDTVYYDPSIASLDVQAHIEIKNTTNGSETYKVRRNGPFDMLCSTNYFCWDLCYTPADNVSTGSLPIAATATNNLFSGHILASGSGVEGCCSISYTFFNEFDLSDTLRVDVVFCGTNSISINEDVYSSFAVYPNPATDFINIEYAGQSNGSFELFNVIGQSVYTEALNAGDQKSAVDVSSLKSGVYFYTLQIDGQVMETKKLIIK